MPLNPAPTTASELIRLIEAADPAAATCTKCKGTGSGFVRFYSSADRLCDCPSGLRLRLRYAFPAESAALEERERLAEAEKRRAARRSRAAIRSAA